MNTSVKGLLVACFGLALSCGDAALAQRCQSCVDDGCVPCYRPSAAPSGNNAAPANPQQQPQQPMAAAPAAPTMYVAPAPTGERVGETRSFGLPEIHFTLPAITLSTPKIRFQGFQRMTRDSQMNLDAASAPQFNGVPAQYAPLASAGAGQFAAAAPTQQLTNAPASTENTPSGNDNSPAGGNNPASPDQENYYDCPPRYYDPCTKNSAEELLKTKTELLALQKQLLEIQLQLQATQNAKGAAPVSQPQARQTPIIQQVAGQQNLPAPFPAGQALPMTAEDVLFRAQQEAAQRLEQKQKALKSFDAFESQNPAPKWWETIPE